MHSVHGGIINRKAAWCDIEPYRLLPHQLCFIKGIFEVLCEKRLIEMAKFGKNFVAAKKNLMHTVGCHPLDRDSVV